MINSYEIGFDDNLGNSLKSFFKDKLVYHYCSRCKRKTKHQQEDLGVMVSPNILSFSLKRFDEKAEVCSDRFSYPIRIEFMGNFSEDYQPSYELFAVIANRGNNLHGIMDNHRNIKKNQYVTIVKRENGEIFEFDPSADAPKQLQGDDDILKERTTAEMLFYREVPRETREASQSSNTSSESSEDPPKESNNSDE